MKRCNFRQIIFLSLLILSLMVSLLLFGATLAPATIADAGNIEQYTSPDNSFTIAIPKDWEKAEKGHPYGDLTKITGLKLTGPKNKDGAAITLSILHYGGEGIFPSAKEFIAHTLNSIARTDYDKQAVIAETTVAAMPGKTFQIRTSQLIYLPMKDRPPMREGIVYEIAPPSIQVGMIQEYIVIPAKKGFFVLHYGAPEDIAGEYHGVFEKVTASFQPHLP